MATASLLVAFLKNENDLIYLYQAINDDVKATD